MDHKRIKVALYGHSGSGKSFIAQYLVEEYQFSWVSTGSICRRISSLLFGNEHKSNLNQISSKLREIDERIWINAALNGLDKQRVVFDSIRYKSDFNFLKSLGYTCIRIVAGSSLEAARLRQRSQVMTSSDHTHESEVSLDCVQFDYTIMNDVDERPDLLNEQIARIIGELSE